MKDWKMSLLTCIPVWAHCDTAVLARWNTPVLGQSWAQSCTPGETQKCNFLSLEIFYYYTCRGTF